MSGLAGSTTRTALTIAADHPAYAGHFPGAPVLPGVVLIDAVLNALEQLGQGPTRRWQIASAKFQNVVRPGEPLSLEHEVLPNGSIRFLIRTGERTVAQGLLAPSQPSAGAVHGDKS